MGMISQKRPDMYINIFVTIIFCSYLNTSNLNCSECFLARSLTWFLLLFDEWEQLNPREVEWLSCSPAAHEQHNLGSCLLGLRPFSLNREGKHNQTGMNVHHILDQTSSSALVCHRPCRSCLCPTPWWSWTHPGPSAWPGLAGLHHFHPGLPADHRWMMPPCAPPLDCQMTRPSGCCFQVLLFLGPRVTRYCISAHLTSPSC